MQYQELASKIRAKYPGSYDDLDDRTLAQKIVAKYPDYSDTTFDDQPAQTQPTSFLDKAKGAYDQYAKTQFGSPQDLLSRADSTIRQGFGKVSNMVTDQMGLENQRNPQIFGHQLNAGVGTAIAMAPDVASLAAPEAKVEQPKPLFRSASEPLAQRSLGLTKRFLKTPFARGKASEAAQVALENNIIPFSGNPHVAMQNATDLQKTSGEALGAMREGVGASAIDPVFDAIEVARQRATNGMRGGAWDTVHRKFDEAQETLMGLMNNGNEVPLKDVERAKKLLSNTVNWVADNVSQESAKQISSAIESGVENIMRSKGADMAAYGAQKRIFGATKTMQKGLGNEISAQAGNNAVSLPTMVAGAGQLATGNVPGAVATLGVMEGLRRRGAGFGARAIEGSGRLLSEPIFKRLSGIPDTVLGAAQAVPRLFKTVDPIAVPVTDATNKLKGLFNQPQRGTEGVSGGRYGHMQQPNNNRNEQQNQNNGNGNSESIGNHNSPKKVITEKKAREYLKKAKGDKHQARAMALNDGWMLA